MTNPLTITTVLLEGGRRQMTLWRCPYRPTCTDGRHMGVPGIVDPLLALLEDWHREQHGPEAVLGLLEQPFSQTVEVGDAP